MNKDIPRTRSMRWQHPVFLVGLTCAVGLLIRVIRIGDKSLWIDEIWSIAISRMPWSSFLRVFGHQDPNMSFYYALLHFWMSFSQSEAFVRAFSALLAVATIPAVYAVGNRLYDESIGVAAGMLLALNGFHIQWSQEARGYSLVVLLVTISTFWFIRCIEQPSLRNWGIYTVASVLAIYTHLFAVLVIVAQWTTLPLLPNKKVPWKALFVSAGAIGFLTFPIAVLLYRKTLEPFVPFDWIPKLTFHDVYDVFYSLTGNATFPGSQGGKLLLIAYFIVCCLALVGSIKVWRISGKSDQSWRAALALCWLVVPIASVLVASIVHPVYVNRYLLICVPALMIIAAKGIVSLGSRRAVMFGLAVMLLLSASRVPRYYAYRAGYQEWRTATQYILAEGHKEDAMIFCVAPGRLLFDYYQDQHRPALGVGMTSLYPNYPEGDKGTDTIDYLPPLDEHELQLAVVGHPRVWVTLYHDKWEREHQFSSRIQTALSRKYMRVDERKIDGLRILLYSDDVANRAAAPWESDGGSVLVGSR